MLKIAPSAFLTLVLFALGTLLQGQSLSRATQTEPAVASKVACSDSSAILPAKRSPEACAESDFALYGHPVMFPLRNGIAYGVSAMPDKPGSLTIWMDNQTEQTQNCLFCCNSTFKDFIQLYDANGRRVPTKIEAENEKLKDSDRVLIQACTCSGWVNVPPHSLKVIDHGDLSSNYAVSPGRYTIIEYAPTAPGATNPPPPTPTLPPSGPRLAVSLP